MAQARNGTRACLSVSDCRSEACLRKGCRGTQWSPHISHLHWMDRRCETGRWPKTTHPSQPVPVFSAAEGERKTASDSFAAEKTKNTYLILKCLSGFWVMPTSSQKLDRKEVQRLRFSYSRQLVLFWSVVLSRCVCAKCYD